MGEGGNHGAIRKRTLLSRLARRVLVALYQWKGWRIDGTRPPIDKFVILGAPHTTNWDFVFFIGATHKLRIRPSFMGKVSLFRWPLRRFMFDMGGLPVDRSQRGNYVDAAIAAFKARDEMALVIAPEGSRTSDGEWRSGFYHIALGAGVPVVPAWVDNELMTGGLGEPIMPTGNFADDLAKIAEFYRDAMPHCQRFRVLEAQARRLQEEKRDG